MKKIFASLLILCMILTSFSTVSFAAEVPTIESSDVTLGDTVTVKVMYPATAKGVSNGSVELVYDNTKLSVVNMTAGALISGIEQTNPEYSEDSVFINWAAAKVINGTTDGFEVVTVTFNSIAAGNAEFSFRQFKVKAGLSNVTLDTSSTKTIKIASDVVPEKHTVTFKNGDQVVESVEVDDGLAIGSEKMPANPTKTGYTFDGWFDSEDSSVEINADTVVTKDITANAKFTQEPVSTEYTVTFKNDDQVVESVKVEAGSAIGSEKMPANPTKTGYTFDGWFDSEDSSVEINADTVVTKDITANAKFTQTYVPTGVAPVITANDVTVGETVTVKVMYPVTAKGVSNGSVELAYDNTKLEVLGMAAGTLISGIEQTNPEYSEDSVFINWAAAKVIDGTKDGFEIVTVTFRSNVAGKATFSLRQFKVKAGLSNVTVDLTNTDKIISIKDENGNVPADPEKFTVKFVEEDGTTLIGTPKTVLEGTTVGTLPTAPAVTGKTFDKWVDESGAEVTADTVVNGNMTVKATYTDNYYTLTFVEEDGTTTIGTPASIKHGDAVGSLPTAPAVTGKNFDKWVDESGAEVTAATVVTKNMKVKATYNDIYYTVTFVGEDGTTTAGTPASVKHGDAIGTLPTAPTVTGKTFAKWVDESGADVTAATVVTKNMKVKATYTDNYYTVTFVEEDGTTTIGTSAPVKHGATIGSLPTAPIVTGKTFDKWVDESGAEVTAATVVTKNMKVKATYTDVYYTVTFVGEDGTTTVGTPASVKHGDAIGTLPTAPTVTGKTFAKWVDESGAEVTAATVVTKNMKVKATYTDNYYTVTFTGKEGAAIGTPESVKHGNKVTTVPTAPEVSGYEFVQWTVDGAAVADPADYVITKETEFKAEYRSLDPNTITDIEVVDADGKVVEAIEIPYGTAIDEIAAAISEAITVNEIKVEGKNNNVAYTTDPDEITERVDSIVIKAAGFAKTIALTYATEDIKIEATEKVSVPFKNHEGKDDPVAIAEYVKGKLTVTVYDIYGIEIEGAEYAVSDYDKETESVTVSYEGAKDVTVAVTLKAKSTGTSAASGTVVRPSTSVPTTKPDTDKPGTEEPGTEEPGTEKPGTEKPGTEEPGTDVPGTEEPGTDVPGTNAPFTDITADDWAYDAIKDLYDRGVISGDATNTVRPADGITREEVSKIILNARGIEVDADAKIDATDASTVSDWAAGYVATAIKEGMLKGYDDGTIQAGKVVTRAEFAAIIVRALGATSEYTASSFTDITSDDWYAADVECAKSLGIVTGYEDGSFKGDQPVTRREAFVMAQRMIKLIEALEK